MPDDQIQQNQIDQMVSDATKAIKSEMYKRVALGVVGIVSGFVALAALGAWTVLRPSLIEQIGGVPPGAVIAFDIEDGKPCPAGWESFKSARARTIIGAGDPSEAPGKMRYDQNGELLSTYIRGQHYGEERVQLFKRNFPSHSHSVPFSSTSTENSRPFGLIEEQNSNYSTRVAVSGASTDSSAYGGDEAHNNMQPYIALYYCKKD
ncbi:hypothetical protein [Hoeflea ulvae]|uniref:Phage tail collar domain-containing protein n=1 Tax=Hoeflea ulvae TaxID=2983764 RepID=A0ABT3YFG2_9HYPH|nr:hypothetical protein [Hoeflea ulvae]MCY0094397.1 hypothetical protein [Hoeflea ulvae]